MQSPARIAATALLLGILADALLHTSPWGANALVWSLLLLGATTMLLQRGRPQPMAAIPALLVFGALLVSADPAFSKLIGDLFAVDIPKTIGHLFFAVFAAGVCGGFLRSLLRGGTIPEFSKPSFLRLGGVEMNTAIAS